MIITQTPVRVSLLGGGTDYPEYFNQHAGATLASSIDKYIYITVNSLTQFFEHRIRVSYSRTELCQELDQIEHPSARECLRFMNIDHGIEINVISDLPARTGLGSSSSFTVGLLHALHAFRGELVGREQLAAEAVYVEREMIKERVGLQDQYTCAIGGLLHLTFCNENRVTVSPVAIPKQRIVALQERLMMFYTGLQRSAHEVLQQQIERTKSGAIKSNLDQLRALVKQGLDVLVSQTHLARFGDVLHQGWLLKRGLSDSVSNPLIEGAYERARQAGATGGKLLGAGGGGFLLLYVEPESQAAVRKALADMREVRFEFEDQGSRLLFYRPQTR